MGYLLEIKNLSKSFGEHTLYHNVSYSFEVGCHAIVGPNGTGKTVLIEMLAGCLNQDAGQIYLHGIGYSQSHAYKQNLTYIPGKPSFFPDVTGSEFLNFISYIKKGKKINHSVNMFIENFKLGPHLDTKFKNMSLGTQKKLFLTTLAMNDCPLIIMDEPTNALDDYSVNFLLEIINKMSSKKIIIIATHDNGLLNSLHPKIMPIVKHSVT